MRTAIIGGTGCRRIIGTASARLDVDTPYGTARLFEKRLGPDTLYLLLRHGEEHDTPPHLVNYRANIAALREVGVTRAVGIYAVGSITDTVVPGAAGLIDQFIDFTGGSRQSTFFTGGSTGVRHIPMVTPYSELLRMQLLQEAARQSVALGARGTYICTNGPRLETPAEIRMFRLWGADHVGMTASTETILACEAGIEFAGIVYSINWAAGVDATGLSFIDDQTIDSIVDRLTSVAQGALFAKSAQE